MEAHTKNLSLHELPKLSSKAIPVNLPIPRKFAITLDSILSSSECKAWIDASEATGYEQALLNGGDDIALLDVDCRRSARCIIDSPAAANSLFLRVRHALPPMMRAASLKQYHLVGLNERLRFLRYDEGDFFASHFDRPYFRRAHHCDGSSENASPARVGEASFVTVQVYLNDGFEGGETTFFPEDDEHGERVPFVPLTGAALVFEHGILHEGSVLRSGRKYAVRTDAMYSPHEGATMYGDAVN